MDQSTNLLFSSFSLSHISTQTTRCSADHPVSNGNVIPADSFRGQSKIRKIRRGHRGRMLQPMLVGKDDDNCRLYPPLVSWYKHVLLSPQNHILRHSHGLSIY